MRVALLSPADRRWEVALADLRHDVYHLPEFVSFAARWQAPDEPCAFIAEEGDRRFFVPFLVRRIPAAVAGQDGLRDAISSRFQPGPLCSAGSDDDARFADRAIQAFADALCEQGIVTAFLRLHPLLPPPLDALRRAGSVVEHLDAVAIDLAQPADVIRQQMRKSHRYEIRAAARDGYVARIDAAWERLDGFVELYAQSMERVGAAADWRLPREHFEDLRRSLGPHLHLCVVELRGELAAAALLTEADGIVGYLFAATGDVHMSASPSKLLIDFATAWAKDRGNRTFYLGGSLARGDPLIRFKLGFSPHIHPILSWRLVADPPAYGALTSRWAALTGRDPDPPDGFFPAYRKQAIASP